jgi:transcription antitermination protein NusB
MQGGIFFLLLIGAVNLVNLLLIRASGRAKEMAMGKRRAARRAALQYHCWRDLHHGAGPETIEELCPAKNNVRLFVRPLIEGMLTHLSEIDERITRYCENYEFRRLSAVDRNVLRLGIFEMFYRDEVIELAKEFGGPDSGRIVNGILDRVKNDLSQPLREAAAPPTAREQNQK